METKIKAEPLETLKGMDRKRLTPFLWFDNKAEEAANFYVSIFKNARVKTSTRYSSDGAAASGLPKGTIMTVAFEIEGHDFTALNGGPVFQPSPAISFMVSCRTREKVDELWSKLSKEGEVLMEIGEYPYSERYGWVQDKFGISWQIMLYNDTQIIAPCLMFPGEQRIAETAINYYMSVFKNSAIESLERYAVEEEGPTGALKFAAFSLDGQKFKAMDSGQEVPFGLTPAISFVVNCKTQEEIDYYWEKLTEGGDDLSQQCGWLQDKFGVSWQVVPESLSLMLSDTESEKGKRVMSELLRMKKLDMNVLQSAYNGQGMSKEDSAEDYDETGANYEGTEYAYRKRDTLTPNEEL